MDGMEVEFFVGVQGFKYSLSCLLDATRLISGDHQAKAIESQAVSLPLAQCSQASNDAWRV